MSESRFRILQAASLLRRYKGLHAKMVRNGFARDGWDEYSRSEDRIITLLELGLATEWCDTCGGPKSNCGPHCKTKGEGAP